MHWERFPFLHAFKGLFQLALRLASHSFFFLLSGLLLELHNSEEKRRMWHLLVTGLNGRKRAYCHRFWGLAVTKTFKTLNKNLLESERETTVCGSNLDHTGYNQSLFKTSPVTRRPSLKRLSGIQVQLLSLCMGKHQILQNCSLSLRLNFIFEITNEIRQQLCHKCCFFCSNSVIKSLFLRLDQPVRMRSPARASQSADCFYSNRDF